jgi:hypothetical protein
MSTAADGPSRDHVRTILPKDFCMIDLSAPPAKCTAAQTTCSSGVRGGELVAE